MAGRWQAGLRPKWGLWGLNLDRLLPKSFGHSISRNVSEENLYSVLENYLIWAFREIANDGIFAKWLGGRSEIA
jgi:hypothetical protein